jgi:hypothetical protein
MILPGEAMLARNLIFLAMVAVALAAFAASVLPKADERGNSLALDRASIAATAARVDAAFAKHWADSGLSPSPLADDLLVARRISLALVGTIPSLEEIRRFEKLPADHRVDSWLAERLADRRYADYVAERLARAFVGVDDGPFLLYRRRRFVAWLAERLAENQPYDRLVRHLIADVGLWTDTPSTNFVTVTIKPDQGLGPDANQLAARVSRAFLGVRIDCAECHDHPFDKWKQRDFQSLAAFFGNTRHSLRGIRDVSGDFQTENRQTGQLETVACEAPWSRDLLPDAGPPRQRLARWVTDPRNRAFAREAANRGWALMFGRPLVEPIDNLPASGDEVLDLVADDFVEHGYDLRRLLAVIASTGVFRRDSRLPQGDADPDSAAAHEAAWATFPLTRLRSEQVVGSLVQSARLATIDADSHILVRFARAIGHREFIDRYGDAGSEEFEPQGGTIPQRLLLMNGKLVEEKTKDSLLTNAATQIAALAPDDDSAVETATLVVLTRRPTKREREHFLARLTERNEEKRSQLLGDLVWTLVNGTEFSWNH